ncbi:metallophosphoesterase [Pedobacter riviphilus]|uniref:Metallophosphoesterase n=1 Tax=Pedobacter riviphilus TaxID=2766984 RepID=A0ABX6TKA6_9SPHI|nr:metallophosphoesterase [Pedobacter riviphilus]QNR85936.1 metallophosphoesterase [Pedobacter riviphilus]
MKRKETIKNKETHQAGQVRQSAQMGKTKQINEMPCKQNPLRVLMLMLFCICLLVPGASAQSEKPDLSFGIIADIQYAQAASRGTRFYKNSLSKLSTAIGELNKEKLAFLVNLGDVTDRNPEDLKPVLNELDKFYNKVYNLVGNHDYAGIENNQSLYKALNMPGEYYAVKKEGWRLLMLNTNELSSYANIKGTWKEAEFDSLSVNARKAGSKNLESYNGALSSRQKLWLENNLQQAVSKNEKVIIFSHHPFSCADGLEVINGKELITLVSRYPCVKALIAGHHHTGGYCEESGIPSVIVEGMVETEQENAWGVVELYKDKIMIKGKGRVTSRTIEFK